MNPFDELTLGEVETLTKVCLDGKPFTDADPFQLAGGVMYMHLRREQPDVGWEAFKSTTKMADIKRFSELMNEDETVNPTNGSMPSHV